jgi:hypothetical protein
MLPVRACRNRASLRIRPMMRQHHELVKPGAKMAARQLFRMVKRPHGRLLFRLELWSRIPTFGPSLPTSPELTAEPRDSASAMFPGTPVALTKARPVSYKRPEIRHRRTFAARRYRGEGVAASVPVRTTRSIRHCAATSGDFPRETDLSTEQARAQAPAWLPRPNGYHGWP